MNVDRLGIDVGSDLKRLAANHQLAMIFDVGGNIGQTALYFAEAFPRATIHTFEPVPETFAQLMSSVKGHENIRAHNVALGASSGVAKMNLTQRSETNSLLGSGGPFGTVDVEMDTVDKFAERNGIDDLDVLKIDVEGYELEVLKGASVLLHQGRIRFVYAECVFAPDTKMPHTSFLDIHEALTRSGLCFVSCYTESFKLEIGCAMANVLYANQARLPKFVPGRVKNVF